MCAAVPSFSARLLFSTHCSFHGKTFKADHSVQETQYDSCCQKSLYQFPCPLPETVPIERLVISSASRGFNFPATLMNKLTAIQELQTQRHFPAAAIPEKLSIVTHTKF